MPNDIKSDSLSGLTHSRNEAREPFGRLLIAANAPEMFRDFLNPFGQHFRRQGWKVDAMARDLRKSGECDGNFDGLLDVNWSRSPWDLENLLQAPRMFREAVETSGYDLI